MSEPVLRRIVRRETHSPRTVAAAVTAAVLILALGYVAVETVLGMAGRPPLLARPGDVLRWLAALPDGQSAVLATVSAALVALGLALILLAVLPGRLSRQEASGNGRAVIVDNGVIATALAQHLSDEIGIARDRLTVGVGHRAIDVTVRAEPWSGVDETEVRAVVEAEVASYQLARRLATRVRIDRPREREPFA